MNPESSRRQVVRADLVRRAIRLKVVAALTFSAMIWGAWETYSASQAVDPDYRLYVPDRSLTPGTIASTDRNEICAPGYAKAHREAFGSEDEYRRYVRRMNDFGVPHGDWHLYEMDHLVPICLGGADTEANMWPQPWAQAIIKDHVEADMCRKVCAGEMTLKDAQHYFMEWGK